MAEKYFTKFPIIEYQNTACRDLTRRVQLDPILRDNMDLYYPVEVGAGFRPDALAEAYYGDPELEWSVYLFNDIVDPYYEWYNSEINFNDFIQTKYATDTKDGVEVAQETIVLYRNNWYEDDNQLSPEVYSSTIDPSWRKYYEPLFTPSGSVYSWRRKRQDWTMNTNRILRYTMVGNSATYTADEIVDFYDSNSSITGGATVIQSNSTTLTVQHVSGNSYTNTDIMLRISGETSGTNLQANAVTTLVENFTNAEAVFWSPVTKYDQELELYEQRRNVNVIADELMLDVVEEVRTKLAANTTA